MLTGPGFLAVALLRGAATIVLDLIAKWVNYDDKIDEVFEASPVLGGLNLKEQAKRANLFFKLREKSLKGILALIDKYLACHGIAHDGLNDLGALVMAVSNSAAKACPCRCSVSSLRSSVETKDAAGSNVEPRPKAKVAKRH